MFESVHHLIFSLFPSDVNGSDFHCYVGNAYKHKRNNVKMLVHTLIHGFRCYHHTNILKSTESVSAWLEIDKVSIIAKYMAIKLVKTDKNVFITTLYQKWSKIRKKIVTRKILSTLVSFQCISSLVCRLACSTEPVLGPEKQCIVKCFHFSLINWFKY